MLRGLCLFDHRYPPRSVGGLRASLRAARWPAQPSFLQTIVSSVQRVSPTRAAACPASGLSARGCARGSCLRVPALRATPLLGLQIVRSRVRRLERHTEPDPWSKGSFSQRLPEKSSASLEGGKWQDRCSLRKPSMAFLASRSRGVLPSNQRGPKRGTIQQTRAVRRTPRLQRTLEAFSRVVACGRWWLRGQPAVCNGRTLRRQALRELDRGRAGSIKNSSFSSTKLELEDI